MNFSALRETHSNKRRKKHIATKEEKKQYILIRIRSDCILQFVEHPLLRSNSYFTYPGGLFLRLLRHTSLPPFHSWYPVSPFQKKKKKTLSGTCLPAIHTCPSFFPPTLWPVSFNDMHSKRSKFSKKRTQIICQTKFKLLIDCYKRYKCIMKFF